MIAQVNPPYDPPFDNNDSGPEIYFCVVNYDATYTSDPNNYLINGYRIKFEAVSDYWNRTGVNYIHHLKTDPLFNIGYFPVKDVNEEYRYLTNDWEWESNKYLWYGFGYEHHPNGDLDEMAMGIYKISVLFHNPPPPIDNETEINYFYIDLRDPDLYVNKSVYNDLDIAIKYFCDNENGSFGVDPFMNDEQDIYQTIPMGSTIRIWELKEHATFDQSKLKINGHPYTEYEIPQNFSLNAPQGGNPILSWDTVAGAQEYHIYRAVEEPGNNYPFVLYAITTNTTYTDYVVTVNKFGPVTYKYKVCSKMAEGYESSFTPVKETRGLLYKQNTNYDNNSTILDLTNFPNPFNPETTIFFRLQKNDFVKITIYAGNGKLIETIVNSNLPKGEYNFQFKAPNLSSGIYFCNISSTKFNKTIKMLYLK